MVWLAALAAPASAGLVVGLSDQHASTFSDLRFRTLPIDHVRLIVPWDVALTDPAYAGEWITAARVRGLTPMVAFERRRGDQCPDAPCYAPSAAEYADAFRAFRLRWPDVTEFAAWNEPNHSGQPYVLAPKAAAALHDILRRACPDCTVVAADVVDNASMKGWINDYSAALKTSVQAWGIHDYGDVTYDRPSYLEWLLARFPEPVWVTETGGIVRLTQNGHDQLPADEQRAAASIEKAFRLADAHADRVARLYLYQWAAAQWETFDAGLLRWDGSERPSLAAVRARLGTVPARPEPTPAPAPTDDPAEQTATPGQTEPTPESAYAGMPVTGGGTVAQALGVRPVAATAIRRSRRGYTVTVSCPAERRLGCHGRLSLAARRDGAAVHLGTATVRVRAGRRARIAVRVPERRMRDARSLRHWRLVAVLVLRNPTSLIETTWNRRT